jgi:hypothetical protein
MGRPRGEVPIDRFNVRLPEPDAEWVKARSAAGHRSCPAVIAEAVRAARLREAGTDQEADEARVLASPQFQAVQQEKEELAVRLLEVRRQLAQQKKATPPGELERMPRWSWPLDSLLGDAEWWDAWLPRLYELMGRETGYDPESRTAVDDRGYIDLMGLLFPAADRVTWRSLMYPVAATAGAGPGRTETRSPAATVSEPGEDRAHAWEPVIRHAARALTALEATERPDADAYRALQVQAEIMGPWVAVLRQLVGPSSRELLDRAGGRQR